MFKRLSNTFSSRSFLYLSALCLLLNGCSLPEKREQVSFERPPLTYADYEKQLKVVPATKADGIKLNMAELLLADKQYPKLGVILADINSNNLNFNQRVRLLCTEAELLSITGNPEKALKRLPKNKHTFPLNLQKRVLATQVRVFKASHLKLAALESRAQLQPLLKTSDDVKNNGLELVEGLQALPMKSLKNYIARKPNQPLTQWINFIINVEPQWLSASEFESKLGQWLYSHPNHSIPASVVDQLRAQARTSTNQPEKIALILPFSGRYAAQAQSIKEGFLAAYYGDSPIRQKIDIAFYDSGQSDADVVRLVRIAQTEGAELIVGPLLKNNIKKLMDADVHKVPLLVLNRADTSDDVPNGVYQFGLIPEDEAEQVAEFVVANQNYRIAAITPRSVIGRRMKNQFAARLSQLGGQMVSSAEYAAGTRDFSDAIKRILDIEQSKSRKSILQAVLRIRLEFEDAGRSDVDGIYIIASPISARSIKPQLKFFDAEALPIFASSQVYDGQASIGLDKDIDGVQFVQSPWILSRPEPAIKTSLKLLNPKSFNKMQHFYALGADAYIVAPKLKRMRENNHIQLEGYTGYLSVTPKGIVKRRLLWAQFHGATPKLLSESRAPVTDTP